MENLSKLVMVRGFFILIKNANRKIHRCGMVVLFPTEIWKETNVSGITILSPH
jgi:hypothetical protein